MKINTSFHHSNKVNDIKYMVAWIDTHKTLEKMHRSFIINTVFKLGMEWTQLSKMKVPCGSPQLTSDSTEKSWEFLFWDQRQDKEAHSPHSCETLTDRLRQSCQTRKRDKGVQTGKREIKLSTDDTIWYIKTLKTQKKKFLKLENNSVMLQLTKWPVRTQWHFYRQNMKDQGKR